MEAKIRGEDLIWNLIPLPAKKMHMYYVLGASVHKPFEKMADTAFQYAKIQRMPPLAYIKLSLIFRSKKSRIEK